MDFEFIEKVVRLVEEADIGELEVESPDGLYLVVKKTPTGINAASAPQMYPQMVHGSIPVPPAGQPVPAPASGSAEGQPTAEEDASVEVVKAPMVGTFYRAPAPDAPPFIEVGKNVTEDTVVCILEAMKVMNEIKAGVSGVVTEILVENGEPVEYGHPLIKVKKG